jgi:hypothetical protein
MGPTRNAFLFVPTIVVTALLGLSPVAQANKPTPTPSPSATPLPGQTVDLRPAGSSGTINGALFTQTDQQPAGTGFIDPFLRVQEKPTEQGYNTDGGFPFDDKHPHNYQHSILQSSLAVFVVNGVSYYKFMLDSNQSGTSYSQHTLSVDQLQIYTSNNPSQTTQTFKPDGTLAFDATTHLAYNLNVGGLTSNSVLTTATGSGKADMYAYIPTSDFIATDKYVILYFFSGGKFPSSGGFEEWVAFTKQQSVPEGTSTFVLSFFALGALVGFRLFVARKLSAPPSQS